MTRDFNSIKANGHHDSFVNFCHLFPQTFCMSWLVCLTFFVLLSEDMTDLSTFTFLFLFTFVGGKRSRSG